MKKIFFSIVAMVATITGFSQTIYTSNGTLTSTRTVTLGGYNLTFKPSNTTASFFINGTTGFTGINTTSPTEALDVNGNIKGKRGFFNNYGVNGQTFATYTPKFKDALALSAGYIANTSTGAGTFSFFDVGSNTTGGVSETGYIWFDLNNRNYNTRLRFKAVENGDSQFTLYDKTQTVNFNIYDDGNNNVTLSMPKANSHICIGTTNWYDGEEYALSVNGNVRADRVKVYTTWADFVFEDEYELPTLPEVEKYIKENGHLENIPSAAEVEEKGIELGEMNKLLLQKVEELTLYMIEQNKVNEQQAKQIEELKAQVKELSEKK